MLKLPKCDINVLNLNRVIVFNQLKKMFNPVKGKHEVTALESLVN